MKFTHGMWFVAVLGSLLLGAAGDYAQAQRTEHFSDAQSAIGSTLYQPAAGSCSLTLEI